MRRASSTFAAIAALTLALAPGLADARAGFARSFGSRGGMTWPAPPSTSTAPLGAQPMQRSITPTLHRPHTAPGRLLAVTELAPALRPASWAASSAPASRGCCWVMGLGRDDGASAVSGIFLLQILLLVLLVRFLVRLFRGPSPSFAGAGSGMFARTGPAGLGSAGAGGHAAQSPIALGPGDYRAFEQSLQDIQAAWSAHDVKALSAMVTPEMLSTFAEHLAEQTSRGVRNSGGRRMCAYSRAISPRLGPSLAATTPPSPCVFP